MICYCTQAMQHDTHIFLLKFYSAHSWFGGACVWTSSVGPSWPPFIHSGQVLVWSLRPLHIHFEMTCISPHKGIDDGTTIFVRTTDVFLFHEPKSWLICVILIWRAQWFWSVILRAVLVFNPVTAPFCVIDWLTGCLFQVFQKFLVPCSIYEKWRKYIKSLTYPYSLQNCMIRRCAP